VSKPDIQNKKGRNPVREQKEYDEEVIQIDRVTRVVRGGRRLRFRATVVIGNRKGKVGVGIGKSTEVTGAISKAIAQAKKSLVEVPITGQTIPHRVYSKFKSAKVLLMPACPGTGIIAGGPLRKVVELAGIKDILSKAIGCNNRLNNSQAAIQALGMLKAIPWLKKIPTVETSENADHNHRTDNRSQGFNRNKPSYAGNSTRHPGQTPANNDARPQHSQGGYQGQRPASTFTPAPAKVVTAEAVKAPEAVTQVTPENAPAAESSEAKA